MVALQEPAMTTVAGRMTPYSVVACLDGVGGAVGEVYVDDGEGLGVIERGEYLLVNFKVTNEAIGYDSGSEIECANEYV